MVDLILLKTQAGDGGNGRVSFLREKFRPKGGPDGGKGGDGGSIFLKGSRHLNTLGHFAGIKTVVAQPGEYGGKRRSTGHKGEDVYLEVPLGTTVWILAENGVSRKRHQFEAYEGHTKQKFKFTKYFLEKEGQHTPPRVIDEEVPVKILAPVRQLPKSDERAGDVEVEEGQKKVAGEDKNETEEIIESRENIDAQRDQAGERQSKLVRSQELVNLDLDKVDKIKFCEVMEEGEVVLLSKGGFGGVGNDLFKSSINTTPLEAEYGTFGERKQIVLELKLLADIGLVGHPNAGKSTLLSILTKAHPKIADYPFTTLEPQLGIMYEKGDDGVGHEFILADIPGILEGAHTGKGLGFTFLRHIEGCKVLLYMLNLEESEIFDDSLSDLTKAQNLIKQWQILKLELQKYGHDVDQKPSLVAVTKIDLYPEALRSSILKEISKTGSEAILFSSITGEGVVQLKTKLLKLILAA